MNSLAFKQSTNSSLGCADLLKMAEQELSAFFRAVKELFGAEQAELSAEDWLHELSETERLPTSIREWRMITTKVSTRLASRVNRSSLSIQPQIA